jgi:RNA polymerase sigma factor (sigma-70 family)
MKITYLKSEDKPQFWSVLYDKYKAVFVKYALRNFAIDSETINDIYQESFSSLYENIQAGKFSESSASLQTYLIAIGKNKLLNYLRDNHLETSDLSEGMILTHHDYELDDWKRKQEIVYQAVCEMQEPCNRILSLFYYDRKSMTEIADTFHYKNEQVAKNRKHLCMGKLKEELFRKLKEEDLI